MPADLLATLGVLPVLEPFDGLVGDAVVAALLQFPVVRVSAERPGPVGGQQAGVLLVVGEVLLLGAADLALAVGGPVGPLAGQGRGSPMRTRVCLA